MIYGLYQSAAGMMVNEYRQNVLANNIANADTAGFKRDVATFAERLPAWEAGQRSGPTAEGLTDLTGGLWLGRTHTDFAPGALQQTGEALDVALDGPGFFVVQHNGREAFTRDGRFVLDARGQLRAASDGAPVLGIGGAPIFLNPRAETTSFNQDGDILQNGRRVGRLALADFDDYDQLLKVGASRFERGDARPVVFGARLQPGHIERSGTEPVQEMVSMIEAARAYQLNAQMVSLQDQTVGRLISQVAAA